MVARTMSNIKLLQTLRGFNKTYFTVADLEKILELERDSLYVTLNRLVKAGVLIKLRRGVYQPEFQSLELEKVANEIYYPSYLSFESALSRYGILSQIPYTLTFATTKRSKKLTLSGREVEYRQLMMSKGKGESDISEWSLVGLKKNRFLRYSKKFPRTVQDNAKKLTTKFGKYVTTLGEKE